MRTYLVSDVNPLPTSLTQRFPDNLPALLNLHNGQSALLIEHKHLGSGQCRVSP
jgi:hypothetical protein